MTMATGAARGYGVSYEQMVTYVEGQMKPLEEHMTAHDNWHRDRLTAEIQSARAIRIAIASATIAGLTGVGGLIVQILVHR
jgi:hypothetical protein